MTMKKFPRKYAVLLLILHLVFTPLVSFGESVTFKLSATIPAIPGVNVPPFNTPGQIIPDADNAWDTSQEEVWNAGEKVVLVTILEK